MSGALNLTRFRYTVHIRDWDESNSFSLTQLALHISGDSWSSLVPGTAKGGGRRPQPLPR